MPVFSIRGTFSIRRKGLIIMYGNHLEVETIYSHIGCSSIFSIPSFIYFRMTMHVFKVACTYDY